MKVETDSFENAFTAYLRKIADVQDAWLDHHMSSYGVDAPQKWRSIDIEFIITNDVVGYFINSTDSSYHSELAPFYADMSESFFDEFVTRSTLRKCLDLILTEQIVGSRAVALAIKIWSDLSLLVGTELTVERAATLMRAKRIKKEDILFKDLIQFHLKSGKYGRPKSLAIDLTDPDVLEQMQNECFGNVEMFPDKLESTPTKEIVFLIDGRPCRKSIGAIETMISRIRKSGFST